jgi:glycosyltransferase involved in cell wall biosynthesis
MAKLIFRNSDFRSYRIPFYDNLCAKYDVRFIFKHNEVPAGYDYISLSRSKSSFWKDRAFIQKYIKMLLSDYDVYVASLPTSSISVFGIIFSKIKRRKIVLWVERWLVPTGTGFKMALKRRYLKFIYSLADSYFVSGTKAEEFVLDFVKADRSTVFKALQANLDLSRVDSLNIDIQIPNDHLVFLYLGRFIKLKGILHLLEAFSIINKKFNKITLILVGDGELKSYYENYAVNIGLSNLLFLPAVDDNDNSLKAGFYNICDAFILPSTIENNQAEGWGLTVGEAMSLGKPVIVTDAVGCSADMVKNGINGYIVKHGCSESLAEALSKMINNKENLCIMGNKSREIFEEKISYEKMSEGMTKAIDYALTC